MPGSHQRIAIALRRGSLRLRADGGTAHITNYRSDASTMDANHSRMAPIFFDHGGRRWKTVRFVLACLLVLAGIFLYFALPQAWHHDEVRPFNAPVPADSVRVNDSSSGLSPSAVAALASKRNTPVIGSGPLVRVVHIQAAQTGKYATTLYSTQPARPLTGQEQDIIGDHEFVLERFGEVTAKRQIALTFDDGPDPLYTPQVLDILARHNVQATFFVTGANVVKHRDIAQREANEGHVIANHTFSHIDFDMVGTTRGQQEINQTQRVITAATGTKSSFFRLPYMGVDEQSMRNHLLGILTAQRMGYTVASNEYDSSDWGFETGVRPQLPKLDGSSLVVLLHDSGGDRTKTIAYLEQLITQAKAQDYQFVNLNQMYSQQPALYGTATASLADKTTFSLASLVLVWPHQVIGKLFLLTVATLLLTMVINVVLAVLNMRRTRFKRRARGYNPLVSVVISAYNEETVLANTVRSLLASHYRNIEIIIVDDGSKDDTGKVAKRLARRHKRVRAFIKQNGGKSSGLNYGIKRAKGDIIIGIDADTIFPPSTVGRLVRHFSDPEVGAVAGNVKVGNIDNMVTRWQALDYIIGIHIERNAQAFLGAVMIVPGACGAWRREAVLAAGGYSHLTLAEDFDLTLSIQRLGYKVLQDNSAYSYTEAPSTVRMLSKQRFRWMYGNVQAYWKHRDMILRRRYGWAGMFVLPSAVFNFMLPVVFVPVLFFVALENILSGNGLVVLIFFCATITIQATMATIGVILARERPSLLLAIPMTRLMYSPMRTWLMYRTVLNVLRGVAVGWNKLQRTGTVQYRQTVRQAQKKLRPALAEQEETVKV